MVVASCALADPDSLEQLAAEDDPVIIYAFEGDPKSEGDQEQKSFRRSIPQLNYGGVAYPNNFAYPTNFASAFGNAGFNPATNFASGLGGIGLNPSTNFASGLGGIGLNPSTNFASSLGNVGLNPSLSNPWLRNVAGSNVLGAGTNNLPSWSTQASSWNNPALQYLGAGNWQSISNPLLYSRGTLGLANNFNDISNNYFSNTIGGVSPYSSVYASDPYLSQSGIFNTQSLLPNGQSTLGYGQSNFAYGQLNPGYAQSSAGYGQSVYNGQPFVRNGQGVFGNYR